MVHARQRIGNNPYEGSGDYTLIDIVMSKMKDNCSLSYLTQTSKEAECFAGLLGFGDGLPNPSEPRPVFIIKSMWCCI